MPTAPPFLRLSTLALLLLASGLLAAASEPSPPANPEAINPACLAPLKSERVRIERVTDGDTVVLTDRRRVRLIGINAAELNEPDKRLRRAAVQATDELARHLPKGEPLLLYFGAEKFDRHGRTLAHVTRASDGLAVAQLLVAMGLAVQTTVAPTTQCTQHLASIEATARANNLGLWKLHDLWSVEARNLDTNNLGFKFVTGTVTRVKRGKRFSEIYLDDTLRILVRSPLAKQLALESYHGQRLEIRGWLSHRKQQVFLWAQHAANLRVLDD